MSFTLNNQELEIDHRIFNIMNTGSLEDKIRLRKLLANRLRIIRNCIELSKRGIKI
jgi:hypothetical protein